MSHVDLIPIIKLSLYESWTIVNNGYTDSKLNTLDKLKTLTENGAI